MKPGSDRRRSCSDCIRRSSSSRRFGGSSKVATRATLIGRRSVREATRDVSEAIFSEPPSVLDIEPLGRRWMRELARVAAKAFVGYGERAFWGLAGGGGA